jgi:hypothetical protein
MYLSSAAQFLDDDVKPRIAERLTCSLITNVRPDGLRNVPVRLCDISETGFMAECEERVGLGSAVSIDLPGIGPTHARIRWNMGGRIGARFITEIELPHSRAAIARETSAG